MGQGAADQEEPKDITAEPEGDHQERVQVLAQQYGDLLSAGSRSSIVVPVNGT